MIRYDIAKSGQSIILTDPILEQLKRQKQKWWQSERGGQLFASLSIAVVEIQLATGPRPTDRRTRCSYLPDRLSEQQEIDACFSKGLHFVGDWHTHSSKQPVPSHADLRVTRSIFQSSTHQLNAFVSIIVGQASFPEGLFVGLFDSLGMHRLTGVVVDSAEQDFS